MWRVLDSILAGSLYCLWLLWFTCSLSYTALTSCKMTFFLQIESSVEPLATTGQTHHRRSSLTRDTSFHKKFRKSLANPAPRWLWTQLKFLEVFLCCWQWLFIACYRIICVEKLIYGLDSGSCTSAAKGLNLSWKNVKIMSLKKCWQVWAIELGCWLMWNVNLRLAGTTTNWIKI